MESLPQELLEVILNFCDAKDVRQVVCCSKQMYSLVTPILWQCVTIPLTSLSREEIKGLGNVENLKYTTHLRICDVEEYTDPEVDEMDEFDLVRRIGKNGFRRGLDNGLILGMLLRYCNPERITFLEVDMCGDSLEFVLEHLCYIKSLSLYSNAVTNISFKDRFANLEELKLNCPAITDAAFEDLMSGKRLRKLDLTNCQHLADDVFSCLSQQKDLDHLHVHAWVGDKTYSIKPICSLINLTYLSLAARIRANEFKVICVKRLFLKEI